MKITVIGSGSWGTAMAGHVAAHCDSVVMWARESDVVASINGEHRNCRYLKDYVLPDNVTATNDRSEAVDGTDGIIVAVPSAFLRSTMESFRGIIDDETPIIALTKGIEEDTGLMMNDLIADALQRDDRIAVLSGPNHAEEVCKGTPAASVIASPSEEVARFFKDLVCDRSLRVYVSDDVIGVETCAAGKNVVAIICGMAAGLGFGDNTLAMLMTRGLAELGRLVSARGGNPMTCMGLSGMGDLVATCTSPHSRNRTFGYAFTHDGKTLDEYQGETGMIVEGAAATKSISELADRIGVDLPITRTVNDVLYRGKSVEDAIEGLLGRSPDTEFYGIADADASGDVDTASDEMREKSAAKQWEDNLAKSCADLNFSYGVAPAELRLSPESRAAIAEELNDRLSRNDAIRRESTLMASGIMPM